MTDFRSRASRALGRHDLTRYKTREQVDDKINDLKQEIQRKANVAHKRLKRLERNNLTDLPAYQQWVDYDGGVRFGVRGKDYNELQAELGRLNRFLDSKTSLVRQANAYMKDIANMTGMRYGSVKELPDKLSNFFKLADKVEEYLRNVEGSASAIGYHKIWEVVNEVVKLEKHDLTESDGDAEGLVSRTIDALLFERVAEFDDTGIWNEVEF